jgi:hypothetical protein
VQKQHEGEVQAKLDSARQKRQEEKERQGALEVRLGFPAARGGSMND